MFYVQTRGSYQRFRSEHSHAQSCILCCVGAINRRLQILNIHHCRDIKLCSKFFTSAPIHDCLSSWCGAVVISVISLACTAHLHLAVAMTCFLFICFSRAMYFEGGFNGKLQTNGNKQNRTHHGRQKRLFWYCLKRSLTKFRWTAVSPSQLQCSKENV